MPEKNPEKEIERLKKENEILKDKLENAPRDLSKDHSLDDKIFVYRRRFPGTVIVQGSTTVPVKRPDGSLEFMPLPGKPPVKIPFKQINADEELKAMFILRKSFTAPRGVTVAEVKALIEHHSQFQVGEIILSAELTEQEAAKMESAVETKAGPKVIAGARATGDQ